ncbi:MAG: hypothetical protein M0Z30_21040 [Actinomycetota bacterium]|nr:hypothetical protein [Actinomycetota bacterium]
MDPHADAADKRRLSTAAALIGKAESSAFAAEQHALVLRAYTELAAFLNALDARDPAKRRRERRLYDRRGASGSGTAGRGRTSRGPDPEPTGGSPVIDLQVRQARTAYREITPRPTPTGVRVNVGL